MTDKALAQVLMAHADDLNREAADREFYLRRIPDRRAELEVLLHLTEQIKQTLVSVQPSPTFVQDLARQLAVTDNSRVERPLQDHRREIFIGAAAVGSALSVIGLVAYLVRSRIQVKTQVASTG